MKSHFQSDSRLEVSDQRHLADGAQGYGFTLAPLGTIKDSFASQARRVGTTQSGGHFRSAHAGPHLGTLPPAGRWAMFRQGAAFINLDVSEGAAPISAQV